MFNKFKFVFIMMAIMVLSTLTVGASPPMLSKTDNKKVTLDVTKSTTSILAINLNVETFALVSKSISTDLATMVKVYNEPVLGIYFVILKSDPKHDNRVINGILNSRQIKFRQSEQLLT